MVDDKALFAKVVDVMGLTVAVVDLLFALVENRDAVEDSLATLFDRI